MSRNKKLFFAFIAIIIVLGSVTLVYFQNQFNKNSLNVGVIIDLSGPSASLGEDARDGMLMAAKVMKNQGLNFSLTFTDDQSNPQNTVSSFNKLVDVNGLSYIISFGSGTSMAISPLASEKKIVLVAVAADPRVLQYNFTTKVNDDPTGYATILTQEVIRRNYTRIYVLADNDATIRAFFVNDFLNSENVSNRVLDVSYIDPSSTDFNTALLKAKIAQPDAIFMVLEPGRVGEMAKEARDMNINLPLFSVGVFDDPSSLQAAQGALENQWFVNPELNSTFISNFKEMFGRIPSREAGDGYDVIAILGQAIMITGNNPEKVNQYLHNLDSFETDAFSGSLLVKNGNFIHLPIVEIINNGTAIPYK